MNAKWITIIVFTVLAVVVWIIVGLSGDPTTEDVNSEYQTYLTPIEDTFDEESLQEIVKREEETMLIDRDALE